MPTLDPDPHAFEDPHLSPVASTATVTASGLLKATGGSFDITGPSAISIEIQPPIKDGQVYVFTDKTGAGHEIICEGQGAPDVPSRVTFSGKKGSSVKLTGKGGRWVPSELNGVAA